MKKHYLKPKIFSFVLLLIALTMIIWGFYTADVKGDMNFFGVAAIGIFLLIMSFTIFFVYRSMEKKLNALFNSEPLLAFTLSPLSVERAIEKNSIALKNNNKAVLFTILVFCGLFAITGPLVVKDGLLFAIICGGIAVFFIFVYLIATAYRTHKLKTGNHEVILNEHGVYFMGQFYTFDAPGACLSKANYDTNEALLSLTVMAETTAGPSNSKIIIPIPIEYRAKMLEILDQLTR